jgi:hypothetical protein
VSGLPDPLAPWLRLHREYQSRWAGHELSEPETADDLALRSSMEDECLSDAGQGVPADEGSRSMLRAVTFSWLTRSNPPDETPDTGDAPDPIALVLRNQTEPEQRRSVWRVWEEAEAASRERRFERLRRQSEICHDSLGMSRTQALLRLSAEPDMQWVASLRDGFEAGDDTFVSILRNRRLPLADGQDSWRLEHGCQRIERYRPQTIESDLNRLRERHPRRALLHVKRKVETFLPRVLSLVEGGPLLVLSGSCGTGAFSDALDAFGRASRAASLAASERLESSWFGDPATELAAGFLFRWTCDDRATYVAERIRLQTRAFLACDAVSFEAGHGSAEDDRCGIAGTLPVHPGWRAARLRANPLAIEVLRGAAYAALQEEWLKTRFGTGWPEEREAWRFLEDLWVSEVGSTAEKVADAFSLGKIESTTLIDRWDPRRIFE